MTKEQKGIQKRLKQKPECLGILLNIEIGKNQPRLDEKVESRRANI